MEPVDGLEEVANASITVTMAYKEVPGFLKYLRYFHLPFRDCFLSIFCVCCLCL